MASAPLTDTEQRMIDFAAVTWRYNGVKEDTIRCDFDMSPTAFYQRLNVLLDRPEALAYSPVTVNRLRRLREERRIRRSA